MSARPLALLAAALTLFSCGTPERAPDDGLRTVTVTGSGATRALAVADARREAVRAAVGSLVLSSTTVESDRMTEDRMVSMSDGYVRSMTVISEQVERDGSVRIKAQAVVVNDVMRETDGARTATVARDENASVSAAERAVDAWTTLKTLLAESRYPIGLFEAEPGSPAIERRGGSAVVRVPLRLKPDATAWRSFMDRAGRAFAALGSKDSSTIWRRRDVGSRRRDLETHPVEIGVVDGMPLVARLTPESSPMLPGPLDNVVVPWDPDSPDRTAMFAELDDDTCRTFTLTPTAFEEIEQAVTAAARRRPVLRITLFDSIGDVVASRSTPLDLNASSCVMLLADMRAGVPNAVLKGSGRMADGRVLTPVRPFMLVPALGLQDVLVRDLAVECRIALPYEQAMRVAEVRTELGW
ncbi:MAG: hypothetical protein LW636_06050 [Planctomycetaceae bacterium]|nr:hypothetical protein [Planctomycetaceae bacterium]